MQRYILTGFEPSRELSRLQQKTALTEFTSGVYLGYTHLYVDDSASLDKDDITLITTYFGQIDKKPSIELATKNVMRTSDVCLVRVSGDAFATIELDVDGTSVTFDLNGYGRALCEWTFPDTGTYIIRFADERVSKQVLSIEVVL